MKKTILFTLALITLLAISTAHAITNDAVAYYSFDNGTYNATSVTDQSGNNINAEYYNLTSVDGILNDSFRYNHTPKMSTQFGSESIPINQGEHFSITLWARWDLGTSSGVRGFLASYVQPGVTNGFELRKATSTDTYSYFIQLEGGGTICTGTGDMTAALDGNFHHWVFTFDNSTCRLYLDNSLISNTSASAGVINHDTTSVWRIGRRFITGGADITSEVWHGDIDEFGIYNRNITSTEVSELYNSGTALNPYAEEPAAESILTVDWDALQPPDNTNTNANITLNYFVNHSLDNLSTCYLYRNNAVLYTDATPTNNANNAFEVESNNYANTDQYFVNCTTNDDVYNTTSTKTIRIDSIDPSTMIYNPTINNQTKVDTSITLNISINNTALNHTSINISGGGDTYYNETYDVTPRVTYTDTVNTSAWTEGNKTIIIYGTDDLNNKTASVQFEVCHAVFACNSYGTCNTSDQTPCVSVIETNCGYDNNSYTGDFSEFSPLSCNYCTSTYSTVSTECTAGTQDTSYYYTNTCCDDTGLPSDCNIPTNQTGVSCTPFTYTGSDVAPATTDAMTKIIIGIGLFATIFGIFAVGYIIIRTALKK